MTSQEIPNGGNVASESGGFWSGRRVFVTGATGFLGSWLVRELRRRGAVTVGLVRDLSAEFNSLCDGEARPRFVALGAVEDFDTLARVIAEYEVDTVFHLAAQPIVGVALRHPRSTFEVNIRGTWNLLEACRQVDGPKRVVVASSDKAYGTADRLPYVEDMPLQGRQPYDVSKSCADLLAHCYRETYGLPVCITRSANFYGGGDLNLNRIVPGTIRSALRGERPVLRSDGTMVRDYIYVRDVVGGYLRLAECMDQPEVQGQAFNFSSEAPASVLDLMHRILAACGREDLEPIILNQAQAEIQEQYLSAAKARSLLGWRSAYTLDRALEETVTWYRSYLERRPDL